MKLTLFESGALVLCGVRNANRATQLAEKVLADVLQHSTLSLDAWQFRNIVGTFALQGVMYSMSRMVQHCDARVGCDYNISLDSEHSPAIQCRRKPGVRDASNVVIQLHHTGRAIISGCRSVDEFYSEILYFVSNVALPAEVL